MSLPARFQHHQPLGAPPRHPLPRPGRLVVRFRSTRRMPGKTRSRLAKGKWYWGVSRSVGGAFQRWEGELFANFKEAPCDGG